MPVTDRSAGDSARNWERNIRHVHIEKCAVDDDPLGFRAVFVVDDVDAAPAGTFAIGASFLAQRWSNLKKAGFMAPMTQKAISMIEERLGRSLLDFNTLHMATA